ncbi:MAG TPA: sulfite exporter TauE/SafE family protein [Campylobacterales bacterium]|nr:sulfite exporter TauE/SafE family protein [Campylobacterales bacterium]
MDIFLVTTGFLAGTLSGFFGVGGGTITVPLLIALGLGIKEAIAVSALQMSFSSVFGSYINYKKSVFDAKAATPFLLGGAFGGVLGAYFTGIANDKTLAVILIVFMIFTVVKLFFSPAAREANEEKNNPPLFFAIGLFIGALGSSVGIGGALLLAPVLVGFLGFGLKKAIGVTLFYVISTSVFAATSFYIAGMLDVIKALQVAVPSIFGVYLGIYMASKTEANKHKGLMLALYVFITASLIFEFFWKR